MRNLAVQFVIEFKYLRELEEKGFDKNNIVIEKKNHKLKEFIKNDIGDSIIIVENKYKELNMKDKLGLVFISDTELSNTNKSNQVPSNEISSQGGSSPETPTGNAKSPLIEVFEVKDNSNIMNEYEPNNIILCFAPLFSIEMIKENTKKEERKTVYLFIKEGWNK